MLPDFTSGVPEHPCWETQVAVAEPHSAIVCRLPEAPPEVLGKLGDQHRVLPVLMSLVVS